MKYFEWSKQCIAVLMLMSLAQSAWAIKQFSYCGTIRVTAEPPSASAPGGMQQMPPMYLPYQMMKSGYLGPLGITCTLNLLR